MVAAFGRVHNPAQLVFGSLVLTMNRSLSECVDEFEVHWDVVCVPCTYGTGMLLGLLFFHLSGVPGCFVGLFVDSTKAQLGRPQVYCAPLMCVFLFFPLRVRGNIFQPVGGVEK